MENKDYKGETLNEQSNRHKEHFLVSFLFSPMTLLSLPLSDKGDINKTPSLKQEWWLYNEVLGCQNKSIQNYRQGQHFDNKINS